MPSLYETLHVADPTKPDAPAPTPLPKMTAKALCREILNSPQYLESLIQRIMFHELPPAVECRLWDYAYGKPVEKVEVKDTTNHTQEMTEEQLERRAALIGSMVADWRAQRQRTNDVVHPSESSNAEEPDDVSTSVH